jgi:RNA polymerase sigma factor (sigma-70 family)
MDMSVQHLFEVRDAVVNHADDRSCDDGLVTLRDCLVANYDRLHRRLMRHLNCSDQATDCLHDAWLRLNEMTLSSVVHNPEAYVYRVACNIAMDHLRRNRSWQYTGDAEAALEHVADHAPGPDVIAEARSNLEAVDRAIRRLPRRHQAVLMALRFDELTRQEVAIRHGISLRSVDTVMRQALDYCGKQAEQLVTTNVRAPGCAFALEPTGA